MGSIVILSSGLAYGSAAETTRGVNFFAGWDGQIKAACGHFFSFNIGEMTGETITQRWVWKFSNEPAWLSFDETSGILSGTAPSCDSGLGKYPFSVEVTDAVGTVVNEPVTVTVEPVSLYTCSTVHVECQGDSTLPSSFDLFPWDNRSIAGFPASALVGGSTEPTVSTCLRNDEKLSWIAGLENYPGVTWVQAKDGAFAFTDNSTVDIDESGATLYAYIYRSWSTPSQPGTYRATYNYSLDNPNTPLAPVSNSHTGNISCSLTTLP